MIPRASADIDALAAEYVLGTLEGQRSDVRWLLVNGPEPGSEPAEIAAVERLRLAVAWWEGQLHSLGHDLPPVVPPDTLWPQIERRLGESPAVVTDLGEHRRTRATVGPLQQRLAAWRLAACVAAAACLALVLWTAGRADGVTSAIAVLTPSAPATATGSFVVERHGDRLRVLAVGAGPTPATHDLELWSLATGKPVPLGLVQPADYLAPAPFVAPGALPSETTVAISLEPAGGSKTGQPTGPVLYVGRLLPIERRS